MRSSFRSERKSLMVEWINAMAPVREKWMRRNSYYYHEHYRYLRFLIPEGLRVLDLGCGAGYQLASLKPAVGVGVDISPAMIDIARGRFPDHDFISGDIENSDTLDALKGPFDVIILSDTIGYLDDCQETLRRLHPLCTSETRVVVSYFSRYWEPVLALAEKVNLKMPQPPLNWLSTDDIANLLQLSDFDVVKRDWRQLVPVSLVGLGSLVNRYIGTLPIVRRFSLRSYLVARPYPRLHRFSENLSVTVLVPCRNEKGNIEQVVTRLPPFVDDIEIMFIEGNSYDGTFGECERVRDAYAETRDIKVFRQDGHGKGDAVRKGFDHARGDILMILDADLTMPPEDLPKFYEALASGKGEFINGSRLVYPMEEQAMRFLNWVANQIFSRLFTWLLNQRFTDTLCGTKVLSRRNYQRIAANRSYFGEFDPFGDFDLIFGAAKLNLKVVEVPIRYANRTYGETQISRFTHGWLLVRMVFFAFFRLKAF